MAQQRAAAAEKRAKKEMEKHEREKQEDEQRYTYNVHVDSAGSNWKERRHELTTVN